MSEKKDYQVFRKHVISPMDRCDRLENILGLGMPDINVCIDGVESWIELKSPKEPKRDSTLLFGSNHKLSQDQKNWFLRQNNADGLSWILIATDRRWFLISGEYADDVNEMTIPDLIARKTWLAWKPIKDYEWLRLRQILSIN